MGRSSCSPRVRVTAPLFLTAFLSYANNFDWCYVWTSDIDYLPVIGARTTCPRAAWVTGSRAIWHT